MLSKGRFCRPEKLQSQCHHVVVNLDLLLVTYVVKSSRTAVPVANTQGTHTVCPKCHLTVNPTLLIINTPTTKELEMVTPGAPFSHTPIIHQQQILQTLSNILSIASIFRDIIAPRLRTSEQPEKGDLSPEPSPHIFYEKPGYPQKTKKQKLRPEHII